MASKTFSYPELQHEVDRAFAKALRNEESVPGCIAYAIWCWIHNSDEVTDHTPVEATTSEVMGYDEVRTKISVSAEEYLRNLLTNQEHTDANIGDITARLENLEEEIATIRDQRPRIVYGDD